MPCIHTLLKQILKVIQYYQFQQPNSLASDYWQVSYPIKAGVQICWSWYYPVQALQMHQLPFQKSVIKFLYSRQGLKTAQIFENTSFLNPDISVSIPPTVLKFFQDIHLKHAHPAQLLENHGKPQKTKVGKTEIQCQTAA